MVKGTNIGSSGASGVSSTASSHHHTSNSNNNHHHHNSSNNNYAGNIHYAQNGVAGLASISGLMSANNFTGHRRAGSSGGSSIGNGGNGGSAMLDAALVARRKPRVTVAAQMEYRARPNSVNNAPPPVSQPSSNPLAARPTSVTMGNPSMPNGLNGSMHRYDMHRRTPSAPRVQGSLHPQSPQSPRVSSSYFAPHSPTHSPRSGSPCSPEFMVNGARLAAGSIYLGGDGSEIDYDGDRSAVSGADMLSNQFRHVRTGSADGLFTRTVKPSGARVSRGNIIEIGALASNATGNVFDHYESDIHDEVDDNENSDDNGTEESDQEDLSGTEENDSNDDVDDVDSDLDISQRHTNDMQQDSPQNRARQMLQGPFSRPRAFSETGRQSDSGESEISNNTRLSARTDIPLGRSQHYPQYNFNQRQISPPQLRSQIRTRPKSMIVSNSNASDALMSTAADDFESGSASNEVLEARTTRKVLDMEMANNLLQEINKTLEQDLRKKTAEVEDLKRKMRRANFEDIFGIKAGEEGESSGGESTSVPLEGLTEDDVNEDVPFQRVCALVEIMRREAVAAIEHIAILPGGRVLTAEELEDPSMDQVEASQLGASRSTDNINDMLDPTESMPSNYSQSTSPMLDQSTTLSTPANNTANLGRIRDLINTLAHRAVLNIQDQPSSNSGLSLSVPDNGKLLTAQSMLSGSQQSEGDVTTIVSELETLLFNMTASNSNSSANNNNSEHRTTATTRKSSKTDTTTSTRSSTGSPPSTRATTTTTTSSRTPNASEMRRGQSSNQTTSSRTTETKRLSAGNTLTRGSSMRNSSSTANVSSTPVSPTNTNTTTGTGTTSGSGTRRTPIASRTRPTAAASAANRVPPMSSTARAK
ncbi:hypothetical protein BDF19DRAFT_410971 [Syncephalis fuscata]|nr:hypothetical protein BDF19DRAFT_410971 [Syncephalis fuscata]